MPRQTESVDIPGAKSRSTDAIIVQLFRYYQSISENQAGITSHIVVYAKVGISSLCKPPGPAELVIILNDSGREGWELVALAPVTDYYPPELIEPTATVPGLDAGEGEEVIPVAAFRYIFKRPLK